MLDDVSLRAPRGSRTAPGSDVRTLPRTPLRRAVGYVEQESPALADSLRDNLRLAAPDSGDDRLWAVVDADQIVVMDGGRVVPTGRHDAGRTTGVRGAREVGSAPR